MDSSSRSRTIRSRRWFAARSLHRSGPARILYSYPILARVVVGTRRPVGRAIYDAAVEHERFSRMGSRRGFFLLELQMIDAFHLAGLVEVGAVAGLVADWVATLGMGNTSGTRVPCVAGFVMIGMTGIGIGDSVPAFSNSDQARP